MKAESKALAGLQQEAAKTKGAGMLWRLAIVVLFSACCMASDDMIARAGRASDSPAEPEPATPYERLDREAKAHIANGGMAAIGAYGDKSESMKAFDTPFAFEAALKLARADLAWTALTKVRGIQRAFYEESGRPLETLMAYDPSEKKASERQVDAITVPSALDAIGLLAAPDPLVRPDQWDVFFHQVQLLVLGDVIASSKFRVLDFIIYEIDDMTVTAVLTTYSPWKIKQAMDMLARVYPEPWARFQVSRVCAELMRETERYAAHQVSVKKAEARLTDDAKRFEDYRKAKAASTLPE